MPGNKPGPGLRRWSPGRRPHCPSPRGSRGDAGCAPTGVGGIRHAGSTEGPVTDVTHVPPASASSRRAPGIPSPSWRDPFLAQKPRFWGTCVKPEAPRPQGQQEHPAPPPVAAGTGTFPTWGMLSQPGSTKCLLQRCEFGVAVPQKTTFHPRFPACSSKTMTVSPMSPPNPPSLGAGTHPVTLEGATSSPGPGFGDNELMP